MPGGRRASNPPTARIGRAHSIRRLTTESRISKTQASKGAAEQSANSKLAALPKADAITVIQALNARIVGRSADFLDRVIGTVGVREAFDARIRARFADLSGTVRVITTVTDDALVITANFTAATIQVFRAVDLKLVRAAVHHGGGNVVHRAVRVAAVGGDGFVYPAVVAVQVVWNVIARAAVAVEIDRAVVTRVDRRRIAA